jgi:hypothetical protein
MANYKIKWIAKTKCYRIKGNWTTLRSATVAAVGMFGTLAAGAIDLLIKTPGPIVKEVLSTAALLFMSIFFLSPLIDSDKRRIEVSKEFITFGRWKKRRYDARLPHRFEITPLKDWLKLPVVKLTFYIGEHQENFTMINAAMQAETLVETFEAIEEALKSGNPTLGRRNPRHNFGILTRLSLNGRVRTHFLPYVQGYTVDMVYLTPFGRLISLSLFALLAIPIVREPLGWRRHSVFINSDAGLILCDIMLVCLYLALLKVLSTPAKQIDISKHTIRFRKGKRILEEYDATLPHRFEAVPLPPPHPTRWHKHATLISYCQDGEPVQTMTIWGERAQEIFGHLQAADRAAQTAVEVV